MMIEQREGLLGILDRVRRRCILSHLCRTGIQINRSWREVLLLFYYYFIAKRAHKIELKTTHTPRITKKSVSVHVYQWHRIVEAISLHPLLHFLHQPRDFTGFQSCMDRGYRST
jgi:hypothetical protein